MRVRGKGTIGHEYTRPIYLNASSNTPISREANMAGQRALRAQLHPWSKPREAALEPSAILRSVRSRFAALVHAPRGADDVAIMDSTAAACTMAAHNAVRTGALGRGRRVIVLEGQMASNVMCWQWAAEVSGATVDVVPRPKVLAGTSARAGDERGWTEAVLARMGDDVGVVAVSPCLWSDGTVVRLAEVGKAARAAGALFVVDATQAAGVVPIDVRELQPDLLCASVQKWLCGPHGVCLAYVAAKNCAGEGARPQNAWTALVEHDRNRVGADDAATWDEVEGVMTERGYPTALVTTASRLDRAGHRLTLMMPMLAASLRQIVNDWRVPAIEAALRPLTDRIAEGAARLGYWVAPREQRCAHIVGIRCSTTQRQAGLTERAAAAAAAAAGVSVSLRVGSIRVSPYLYNTAEDCDALLEALRTAAEASNGRAKL